MRHLGGATPFGKNALVVKGNGQTLQARQGKARQGKARQGKARQGKARLLRVMGGLGKAVWVEQFG
jgi:hypothetical protein